MEVKDNISSNIIFITGGTKSGKSEFAEYLGRKISKITYQNHNNQKHLLF